MNVPEILQSITKGQWLELIDGTWAWVPMPSIDSHCNSPWRQYKRLKPWLNWAKQYKALDLRWFMQVSWRDIARERILTVLMEQEAQAACLGEPLDHKTVLKAISKAYPFGQRKYHPYKVWCSEVRLAKLFLQSGLPARNYTVMAHELMYRRVHEPTEGQMTLFWRDEECQKRKRCKQLLNIN